MVLPGIAMVEIDAGSVVFGSDDEIGGAVPVKVANRRIGENRSCDGACLDGRVVTEFVILLRRQF